MAPQGSSPDGFSREVQLFCVALGRVVAVSDLCLPVIPKRRSGQLAPSNNNPERSNDPLSASWELSRSPSGKTRGPSRHDQFALTNKSAQHYLFATVVPSPSPTRTNRSEEHTSELQSLR